MNQSSHSEPSSGASGGGAGGASAAGSGPALNGSTTASRATDAGAQVGPVDAEWAADAARERAPLAGLRLGAMERALFLAMRAALYLLSLLPDFALYPLGMFGGYLAYLLDRRHVAIGMINLGIAFPDRGERERRRILRASYVNLGRSAAEYVRLAGWFPRRLTRRVIYERFDYWDELKRQFPGRGIVVLTAHFGNFELMAAAHAMHGHQITLVHHTQRFAAGDALMTWVRERAGVNIVRKRSAARAVLKALGDGQLVGVPFDQNAKRGEAIFVPFFGEPAATSRTLARVVARTNALVVPVFIVRQPSNRAHRIVIQERIELCASADAEVALEQNTRRFLRAIEDIVRRYPEQFLWQHRRYRTRPRGMAPLYEERARHRDSRPARASQPR
ncbi:MAG TPA: lysophospholipid acyltransferase family protein [Candidatus Binataceae bacterium]|nr:lysophospholipid acyltransferase family protein [Candidatus Binataceae bacterium]